MAESFCGKTCQICSLKNEQKCPGCRVGPGRAFSGDCEIARCCRAKGHAECETCSLRGNCGKLFGREGMASYRQQKQNEEKEEYARLTRKLPALEKWTRWLFIIAICSVVSSFLASDDLAAVAPGFYRIWSVVDLLVSIASGVVLLQLAGISGRFRIAGWCVIAVTLLDFLPNLLPEAKWMAVLAFISMVPALIGLYQQMQAFAEELEGIDDELAEKWRKLWFWHFISLVVTLFSGLLVMLASVLGALIMLAAMIVLVVVSVLRIVYLYRTAQRFQYFLEKIQEKCEISS